MARRSVLIVAAAVLLLTAAGVVRWRVFDRAEPEPVPPVGTRYVGSDGVVLAVPIEWRTVPSAPCGSAGFRFSYVTAEQREGVWCPAMFGRPRSHTVIGPGADEQALRGLRFGRVVDGPSQLNVEVSDIDCRRESLCRAAIRISDPPLVFDFYLFPEEASSTLGLATSSLHVLPDGWTTVPFLDDLGHDAPGLQGVRDALDRAGLQAKVVTAYARRVVPDTVLSSDPPMGAVIREGGTVTLTVTTTDATPRAGAGSSP